MSPMLKTSSLLKMIRGTPCIEHACTRSSKNPDTYWKHILKKYIIYYILNNKIMFIKLQKLSQNTVTSTIKLFNRKTTVLFLILTVQRTWNDEKQQLCNEDTQVHNPILVNNLFFKLPVNFCDLLHHLLNIKVYKGHLSFSQFYEFHYSVDELELINFNRNGKKSKQTY